MLCGVYLSVTSQYSTKTAKHWLSFPLPVSFVSSPEFLADHTIGRAYGTVCRLSSSVCCRLSVTFYIVAKRCILAKKCLKE